MVKLNNRPPEPKEDPRPAKIGHLVLQGVLSPSRENEDTPPFRLSGLRRFVSPAGDSQDDVSDWF